jgi:DNA-binding transcriptional LysR family regulator
MNITSRQLKAFLLTARYQSFSRAADHLFITQSGMSVLVRELEEQLGFRLFQRTTRKVTLTEFGSRFLPVADRSVVELEAAASSIGRSLASPRSTLAFGAAPFIAGDILPQAIAAFAASGARLDVRLVDAKLPVLVQLLQSGELDVALSASEHNFAGLQKAPLVGFPLVLIAAKSLPIEEPVRWADAVRMRLVGYRTENPVRQLVDHALRAAGRHTPPEVLCNYLETQIAMVEVGSGVAVVPSFAAASCAKRDIAVYRLTDPVVSGTLYYLVKRSHKLPPGSEAFIAFLRDLIGRSQDGGRPEEHLRLVQSQTRVSPPNHEKRARKRSDPGSWRSA